MYKRGFAHLAILAFLGVLVAGVVAAAAITTRGTNFMNQAKGRSENVLPAKTDKTAVSADLTEQDLDSDEQVVEDTEEIDKLEREASPYGNAGEIKGPKPTGWSETVGKKDGWDNKPTVTPTTSEIPEPTVVTEPVPVDDPLVNFIQTIFEAPKKYLQRLFKFSD